MGDIADMMLDGTLCEGCGEYLGADGGFPQRCPSCEQAEAKPITQSAKPSVPKVACPTCGKMVRMTGIGDHWKQHS